jgi:methionyl-tRNA formyltransferase
MALKVIFAGTPQFAVPTLHALIDSPHEVVAVYTQPDRPAGRGRKLQMGPIKMLALDHQLDVQQPESFRDANTIQQFKSYAADIMVVVAYGLLLPESILKAPPLGCINVHASLLPRWRGAAPIQHAILSGDKETGITIIKLIKELDAGDMLNRIAIKIAPNTTSEKLYSDLSILGAELLLKTLDAIEHGQTRAIAQGSQLVTYANKINKTDAEINWQLSAIEIERKIRAYYGWPVAFTNWNNEIVRIWEAQVLNKNTELKPGQFKVTKDAMEVGCGQGCLQLKKLQLPGKRALEIHDFLNAYRDKLHVNYFR